MKPGKHKRSKQNAKVYVGRSTTVHNLLFFVHTLCMSYVIKTFLLVSSSVSGKQLLCLCTVKAKIERTKTYDKELCRVS